MIGILYSCPGCGLTNIVCELPTRPESEDVLVWKKRAEAALGDDHARRSPTCSPEYLKDVKIPLYIGGALVR